MKQLTLLTILTLFTINAHATYCSLEHPEYCPEQNTGSTNSLNTLNNLTNSVNFSNSNSNDLNSSSNANSNSNSYGQGGTSTVRVNGGSTRFDQVRQAPMAYAPSIQLGANAFNCANSASFGASSPFGGVSLGIPLTADNCPTFVMSQYLYSIGQPIQGCEILNNIPEIADVRKKTNFSCIQVVVATPIVRDKTWLDNFNKRFPPIDSKLDAIHEQQMRK